MNHLYPSRYAKLATCNMSQWALDFSGNKERIIKSIRMAKDQGCGLRLGSELEITGYSCEDHFLEIDTVNHSWEILAEILATDATKNIICCVGMPLIHQNLLFNCSIFLLDQKLLLIRPKQILSDYGNYREGRYFTAWNKSQLEDYLLPEVIQKANGQITVPIGNAIIQTKDTEIAIEMYEELWQMNPLSRSIELESVEIFLTNNVIHQQLNELESRIRTFTDTTFKNGGIHMYSNQIGCDGGRLYFDGSCMIVANGELLGIGSQFSLKDVEVKPCLINLDEITSKKLCLKSPSGALSSTNKIPKIRVDFKVTQDFEPKKMELPLSTPIKDIIPTFQEEIAKGPACYMFNYLKRSEPLEKSGT